MDYRNGHPYLNEDQRNVHVWASLRTTNDELRLMAGLSPCFLQSKWLNPLPGCYTFNKLTIKRFYEWLDVIAPLKTGQHSSKGAHLFSSFSFILRIRASAPPLAWSPRSWNSARGQSIKLLVPVENMHDTTWFRSLHLVLPAERSVLIDHRSSFTSVYIWHSP